MLKTEELRISVLGDSDKALTLLSGKCKGRERCRAFFSILEHQD